MRVSGAILVASAILFGLQGFFAYREANRVPPAKRFVARTSNRFDVEITLTFDAGPDAFALEADKQAALVVESLGERVYLETQPIAAGTVVRFPLENQIVGGNELFVRAAVADTAAPIRRAMRVRVFRGGTLIVAEESFWAEPGEAVQGTVRFQVAGGDDESEDGGEQS